MAKGWNPLTHPPPVNGKGNSEAGVACAGQN
jgi:hypothetical protein